MLDYDGTLAPHRAARARAAPARGALIRLIRIARDPGTTLAIVSGRRADELDRLFRGLPAWRFAEHGWEERHPDGARIAHPLPAAEARALAAAEAAVRPLLPPSRLERKRAAIVLHTRGLPSAAARATARATRRIWAPIARRAALRLDIASGGLELRAAARDKGTVARALLKALPARTLPVFLGDDRSDEDAFAVVARRGVGIRVGRDARASHARARIASPAAVVRFLDRWIALPAAPRGSARGRR